jgi:hypothetical protein
LDESNPRNLPATVLTVRTAAGLPGRTAAGLATRAAAVRPEINIVGTRIQKKRTLTYELFWQLGVRHRRPPPLAWPVKPRYESCPWPSRWRPCLGDGQRAAMQLGRAHTIFRRSVGYGGLQVGDGGHQSGHALSRQKGGVNCRAVASGRISTV